MNKLIIIGRLVRDVERHMLGDGRVVVEFDVAVDRQKSDEADFFHVSHWGSGLDNMLPYLVRGKKVTVCGDVRTRAYLDRDGNPRASMDVSAREIELL